jgi:hypothetical protein
MHVYRDLKYWLDLRLCMGGDLCDIQWDRVHLILQHLHVILSANIIGYTMIYSCGWRASPSRQKYFESVVKKCIYACYYILLYLFIIFHCISVVFNLCSCQFLQSLVPSRMADAEVPGQLRSAELWLSCLARGRAAILDLPGVHLPRKLLRTRNRWQSVAKSVAIRVRVCACKTSMDFNKGLPYQKCCDSHSTRKKQTPIIWASLKHISAKIGRHKRACIQGGRDWHVVEDHEHVWTEHHNEAATQPRKRDWIESSALQNPMSNKEGLNRIVKAMEIMGNHGEIMGKSWKWPKRLPIHGSPSICPACGATETDLRPWGIHSTCRCWSLRVTTSSARELKCHWCAMRLIMTSCRQIVDR